MQRLDLHPFDRKSAPPVTIQAVVWRPYDRLLVLTFELRGEVDRIAWPSPKARAFADELWRHTCFEAFCKQEGCDEYDEVNLSPSGEYASYRFDRTREGMRRTTSVDVATFDFKAVDGGYNLTAGVYFFQQSRTPLWQVALSAVIELVDGRLSHWALAHPCGTPDFHDPRSFTLRVKETPLK